MSLLVLVSGHHRLASAMPDFHELIMRSLQGQVTPDEEHRLVRWRLDHPDHERQYAEIAALWALVGVAQPDYTVTVPASAEVLRAAAARGATPLLVGQPRPTAEARLSAGRAWWQRHWLKAASLAVAGVSALVLGAVEVRSRAAVNRPAWEGAVATGPGEMTTVTLSDGTSIRLAENSRLRLSETDDLRLAWLEGRAFFGVRSDMRRPFVVHTQHGEARVLGTRFEVDARREELTVLVVEGSVAVNASGEEVRMGAGEVTRATAGSPPVTARVPNVYERLNWIGTAVVFQSTPVRDVISEIEGRFGVVVELGDSRLEGILITAAFTGESVHEVLDVVCEVINATCTADGDVIRIDLT